MNVGERVSVTLGDRQVSVEVTEKNKRMLADGDLTNDLFDANPADAMDNSIAGTTGDKAKLSIDDFKAAFTVADAGVLSRMSKGIKAYDLNTTALGTSERNFTTVFTAKPYLGVKTYGTDGKTVTGYTPATAQSLESRLANMTVTGRNGVLSELATETAMLDQATAANVQIADRRPFINKILSTDKDAYGSTPSLETKVKRALAEMPGDDVANKNALIEAVLLHPDLPLATRHALLEALSTYGPKDPAAPNPDPNDFTKLANRTTAIDGARDKALGEIKTRAEAIFTKLGGTGTMGFALTMATGDGTGTNGIGNLANKCLAYMSYGAPTTTSKSVSSSATVGGISTQTKTYTPKDITKPVAFHVSAAGANDKGSTLTFTRAGVTTTLDISVLGSNATDIGPLKNTNGSNKLPPGVTWNAASQTLTFPPGSDPITVTQASGADEVTTSTVGFNVDDGPSLSIDFGELFASDKFTINWNELTPDQQKQIDDYCTYLAADPTRTLELDIEGLGPTDYDGSAMTEISGYGAEGTETSVGALGPLRSSVLDVDVTTGKGKITATTDPVRSSLLNADKSCLGPEGRANLKKYCDKNGLYKTDNQGNKTYQLNKPLAGMRAYSIQALMEQRLIAKGGKPDQIKVTEATVGNGKGTKFDETTMQGIVGDVPLVDFTPKP
jgi:hypothetical protein